MTALFQIRNYVKYWRLVCPNQFQRNVEKFCIYS